ncbi:MAG TPA: hypothetical protein VF175_06740 [Lacipirellula sp.]
MLRFDHHRARSKQRPRSPTRGVWMLLLMLGAMLVLMRQLEQPETAAFLNRIFSSPAEPAAPGEGEAPAEPDARTDVAARREPRPPVPEDGPWAAVEDNAMFLDAEHEAWFLLWAQAKRYTPEELNRQAIAEVTYAQLVNQPDVYRAQAVRVRGRIVRESLKRAPKNDLGIREYHQLVLAPIGGGDWPVIVYALNLPPGFPRGDGLQEDVALTGLFFKNWSSPDGEGMGLFPVLVARSFNWHAPQAAPIAKTGGADLTGVRIGAGAALLAAIGFIVWVARQTRRPRTAEEASPDFQSLSSDP